MRADECLHTIFGVAFHFPKERCAKGKVGAELWGWIQKGLYDHAGLGQGGGDLRRGVKHPHPNGATARAGLGNQGQGPFKRLWAIGMVCAGGGDKGYAHALAPLVGEELVSGDFHQLGVGRCQGQVGVGQQEGVGVSPWNDEVDVVLGHGAGHGLCEAGCVCVGGKLTATSHDRVPGLCGFRSPPTRTRC